MDGQAMLPRYQRIDTCAECGHKCRGVLCEPARHPQLRDYTGIRFTADGFDCALPVAIDSFNKCSYSCLYCFTDNIIGHRVGQQRPLGMTSLAKIEALFSGQGGREMDIIRQALKYDRRNAAGYPCPVQLGALAEPCDNIERQQGWLLKFIEVAIKYNQPVRISTKGTLFSIQEYQYAISKAPHLFWVAFSIITPDDELIAKIDRFAPNASERLQTMAELSKLGVNTSLRLRPILPGASDHTPNHPQAYKELITRAAQNGARAISCEVAFVPGAMNPDMKKKWHLLSAILNRDLPRLYSGFGDMQSCTRPSYLWTEEIMHKIVEEAHNNGLMVGVSDPVWKELGDVGCCCGIPPDDPVFGNWQRESATNQLLEAKATGKELSYRDITPAWAHEIKLGNLVNLGAGPLVAYIKRHKTWADYLKDKWNNPGAERGPLVYFQGALMPTRWDSDGNLYYKFVGLKRQFESTIWRVCDG